MKVKLVCLIGLALGGIIGAVVGGNKIQQMKREQANLDAKLEELRQNEIVLLKELEAYHKVTDEEIQKTKELIELLKTLDLTDPMNMDISIDDEDAN